MNQHRVISRSAGWDDFGLDHEQYPDTESLPEVKRAIGLGDAVEVIAKPIGCVIDRVTAKAPIWLVKPHTYGLPQLLPPGHMRRSLKYRLTHHALRLPGTWRTSFCAKKPGCGCARRQAKLNQIVPEIRSATAWIQACKTLGARLNSHVLHPL